MLCFNKHAISDLYSWTDENGNKRYTTSPPPDEIPARVTPIKQKDNISIKVRAPDKSQNTPNRNTTGEQIQPDKKEAQLALLLFFKEQCETLRPHIFDNIQDEIKLWEHSNSDLASGVRNSSFYKSLLNRLQQAEVVKYDKNVSKSCNGVEEFFINESSTTIYTSPEEVWEAYIGFLKNGDKKSAVQCLTSIARRKYKPLIERMNNKQLNKMAASIVSIKYSEEASDSITSGYAVKANGKVGVISFINNNYGWKIYDM